MNNLKQLFWNQYEPIDERERIIYLKAYKRAYFGLVFYVIGVCNLGLAWLNGYEPATGGPYVSLNIWHLMVVMLAGLFLAQFVGWTALRQEQLSFSTRGNNTPLRRLGQMLAFLAVLAALGVLFYLLEQ